MRKRSLVGVLLALVLAFGPATPWAQGPSTTPQPEGAGKAVKYIACAGSIVLMVWTPGSVFFTTVVCLNAFMDD